MSVAIQQHMLQPTDHDHLSWQEQLARRRRRRPVALANWLLMDLQALDLRGETDIPASFQKPLAELVTLLTAFPESLEHRTTLEHPASIADLLYALTATERTLTGEAG